MIIASKISTILSKDRHMLASPSQHYWINDASLNGTPNSRHANIKCNPYDVPIINSCCYE
jgi:hypothetical protein